MNIKSLFTETRVKIHLWKSCAITPLLSACFYLLIFPFKGTRLYVLFYETGAMPVYCTLCMFLALLLLFFRFFEHKKDFDSIECLESSLTTVGKISSQNSTELIDNMRKIKLFSQGELTFQRFLRLMRHVESGSSWSETESLVKGMGDFDQESVESAYTWVKFLIWLIPILGFIGTVVGIGEAIGGFNSILSTSANFDAMKSSLGGITDSLAYAFDSTLVALLQTAVIMFILSLVQKQGDDLMVKLDEVFTDDILVRVEHVEYSGGQSGFDEKTIEVLKRFSESAEKLEYLAKLDSFEGVLLDLKNTLSELKPTIDSLKKKRSLHFKLQEVDESE